MNYHLLGVAEKEKQVMSMCTFHHQSLWIIQYLLPQPPR